MSYIDSWKVRKKLFKKRKVTIEEINNFLTKHYNKELEELKMNPINTIDKKLEKKQFIVYIKNFKVLDESLPIICGRTKSNGISSSVNINLNIHANDDRVFNGITGRQFLQDENLDFDKEKVYLFECSDEKESRLLQSIIQNEFNLFCT